MMIQVERRLWTVDEYHSMVEAGILEEDDRIELLEGEIVRLSPVGVRHIACVNQLNRLLSHHLFDQAIVSVQNPVRLSDLTEPEPDVVLLEFRADIYAEQPATAENILLLIEVSNSTLAYDWQIKGSLYARAAVPEYWIVNLIDNTIEVYRQPEGDAYTQTFIVDRTQEIAAVAFPDVTFKVSDLIR